jgi:hypothetical protein
MQRNDVDTESSNTREKEAYLKYGAFFSEYAAY